MSHVHPCCTWNTSVHVMAITKVTPVTHAVLEGSQRQNTVVRVAREDHLAVYTRSQRSYRSLRRRGSDRSRALQDGVSLSPKQQALIRPHSNLSSAPPLVGVNCSSKVQASRTPRCTCDQSKYRSAGEHLSRSGANDLDTPRACVPYKHACLMVSSC